VASHPVERIDIVEIAPSVPVAAQLFEEENDRVLDDPRVRLIIADGRNQLLVARTRYDVITADPIHPWTAGASSLYSEDHYRLAKARLKPGGIMCQWLPLYEMDPGSARTIVRTFSAVFPYTTIWSNGFSDAIMIGTDQPLRIDVEAFSKRFHRQAIRANLTQIDVKSPWSLLAGFLLDKGAVDAYAGDAAMNTDDRPILEFVAPKSIYVDTVPSNLLALLRQRATLGPYLVSADDLASQAIERRFYATGEVLEGWAKARLGKEREAEALFERALAVDPDHLLARRLMSRLLVKRGEIAIGRGRLEEAKSTLDRALSLYPSFKAHVALGTVYALGEQLNAAILEYRRALELEPDADAAHKNLGLALIKAGQHENEAKRHLQRALVLNPTDPEAGKVRLIIKHLSANKTAPQK
jgi:tetratricopeptide (TPR) repeat protein